MSKYQVSLFPKLIVICWKSLSPERDSSLSSHDFHQTAIVEVLLSMPVPLRSSLPLKSNANKKNYEKLMLNETLPFKQ
jgi:hypothetical protein